MADICARWEVRATVVGTVTAPDPAGGGRLRIRDGCDGPVLADVPAASLSDDAPLYDRPRRAPRRAPRRRPRRPARPTAAPTCLALLRSPRLGLPPVRPPAVLEHGGRARAPTPRCCAWPGPGCRPPRRGVGADHRLQPARRARSTPAPAPRSSWPRAWPTWPASGADAGGRRQLPQLRQPRASRGHVAALRVHRRDGRGLPGPGAAGDRRQRQPLQRERRAPTSTPRRCSACSAWSTSSRAPPPGWPGPTGDTVVLLGAARGGGRVVPPGGHPLGHRAPRPPRPGALPAVDFAAHARGVRLRGRAGGRPGRCRGAARPLRRRRARRVGRRPGRGPGRDGGRRRRRRLRGRRSTTRPSSSPSCRRASWWPPPTPTSCAPGAAAARDPRRPSSGRAGGDRFAARGPGRPARSDAVPRRRPTRATWPRRWAKS